MVAKLQWDDIYIDLVGRCWYHINVLRSQDARFRFDMLEKKGDVTRVQLPHPEILEALTPGKQLLLCSTGSTMVTTGECVIVSMHFWRFGFLPSSLNSSRTIQSRFARHCSRIYCKTDLYAWFKDVDRLTHAFNSADLDYHSRRI